MEGKEGSTHICKKCGGKIMYLAHKLERVDSVVTVKCPSCGAIIPELDGAKVVAYFKKKAGQ